MRIVRRNRVERLYDFPIEMRVHHRALDELAVTPFEPPPARRCAQGLEMRSARGSRRSGGDQRRAPRNCPVAIDAIELNGSTRLAVKSSAAMAVLLEVTIDALHPFLQVNILEMHGTISRR